MSRFLRKLDALIHYDCNPPYGTCTCYSPLYVCVQRTGLSN